MPIGDQQKILTVDINALKDSVQGALNKVGKTFTWTRFPVSAGVKIGAADVLELRSATNVAYDAVNPGCTANDTVDIYDSILSGKDTYDSDKIVDTYDSICSYNSAIYDYFVGW